MPARKVELHKEAITESPAAREWYEARNTAAAEAFMEELDHAIEQIREFPISGVSYIAKTRRYLMRRFPFAVVYREREHAIEVVAVAHTRRRPGYWKSRVK